jgi:mono/diheme cytochrome c family protein
MRACAANFGNFRPNQTQPTDRHPIENPAVTANIREDSRRIGSNRVGAGVERSKLIQLLILAALATVALGALGAFAFIKSGLYNVGAARPHTKLTFWVTNETMTHSVKRHAKGIVAPANVSAAQVMRGFCAYETHCVACHGAAGVARQHWAGGMEPQPPYLLDATQTFRPRELFWIVRNGIKMTGMPAWQDSLTDEQVWEVVAWLEASRRLPPQTYVAWRRERRCTPSP